MRPALLYGSKGDTLLIVAWLWTAIATLLMILRTLNAALERSKERSSAFGLRWDFVWVVLAYALALTATITTTDGLLRAAGTDQGLETLSHVIYTGLVANTSALFAMSFGRLAVVALLISLHSGTTYKSGRISLWVIGITQFVINCIQVGFTIHQCSPVRRLWEVSIQGTCEYIEFNRKLGYFTGSFGAFCDFFLAAYPAALIIGPLQGMKPSLKVAICFVMGGGVVAGIAGIIKTVQITNILHVSQDYATVVK